eukprot:4431315-Prymnesium_polylepis.1
MVIDLDPQEDTEEQLEHIEDMNIADEPEPALNQQGHQAPEPAAPAPEPAAPAPEPAAPAPEPAAPAAEPAAPAAAPAAAELAAEPEAEPFLECSLCLGEVLGQPFECPVSGKHCLCYDCIVEYLQTI